MGRWLLSMPIALCCTVAIFSLMALMLNHQDGSVAQERPPLRVDMVMLDKEPPLKRRQRSLPKPPQTLIKPEPMPLAKPTASEPALEITPISPAALGLNSAFDGVTVKAAQLTSAMFGNSGFGDSGLGKPALDSQNLKVERPLYRTKPNYPARALKRGIEGYVVMQFTIDPTGRAVNIKVLEAKPKRMFEREAIRALKKWKYQPKIVAGEAISQPSQSVRVEFNITK